MFAFEIVVTPAPTRMVARIIYGFPAPTADWIAAPLGTVGDEAGVPSTVASFAIPGLLGGVGEPGSALST